MYIYIYTYIYIYMHVCIAVLPKGSGIQCYDPPQAAAASIDNSLPPPQKGGGGNVWTSLRHLRLTWMRECDHVMKRKQRKREGDRQRERLNVLRRKAEQHVSQHLRTPKQTSANLHPSQTHQQEKHMTTHHSITLPNSRNHHKQ